MACINAVNSHNIMALQVFRQGFRCTPVAGFKTTFTHYKTAYVWLFGFHIIGIDVVIADMGIGHGYNLPGIRRVCKDFLISGHTGIEHQFSGRFTFRAHSAPFKYASVFYCKYGFFHG